GRALGALVALRPGRSSRANVARQADVALRSGGASCASGPRLALRASRSGRSSLTLRTRSPGLPLRTGGSGRTDIALSACGAHLTLRPGRANSAGRTCLASSTRRTGRTLHAADVLPGVAVPDVEAAADQVGVARRAGPRQLGRIGQRTENVQAGADRPGWAGGASNGRSSPGRAGRADIALRASGSEIALRALRTRRALRAGRTGLTLRARGADRTDFTLRTGVSHGALRTRGSDLALDALRTLFAG
ncbi:hypothetical protein, partial [Thiohalocapsa marina]|uniref:hypothetical protein n=1 Tax=Thiohalocapsa marina TaxID=424902 RepID=UPI0036D79380